MRARALRAATWFVLGTWCLQAAWIFAVPPYRGLDEHEHAYKAAAVARGDWSPRHPSSPDGWGDRMTVPADVVDSARPVCESLPYTTPDNCRGSSADDGLRTVASSAARYNPLFYAVIGSAALPFEGTTALYVMRLSTALLCSLLLGAAAYVTARRGSSMWGWVCFSGALTPIVLYSSAMAAPNGVELAAAALVWSGVVALGRHGVPRGHSDLPYVTAITAGGAVLATVRTLGPLWLVLILAAAALFLGRQRTRQVLGNRAGGAATSVLAVACLAGLAWTAAARTNDPGGPLRVTGEAWAALPGGWAMWLFQSIAAFPARDEIAPLGLYAVTLTVWAVILLLGLRAGRRRLGTAVALVVACSLLVPSAATLMTHAELGIAWQGRYGYPVAMGVIMLCAAAEPRPPGAVAPALKILGVVLPAATVGLIGVLDVVRGERVDSPLAGTSAWIVPPDASLALFVLAGAVMWGRAAIVATRPQRGSDPAPHVSPTRRVSTLPE
ncbi:DUF2142 domain-containing protein [Nocardioides sp. zg-579]|uniref:DUF2142 domain-containing protein n=2 Tax=Nocardioides marmotae TaxID=2663857 RepID=A0A6I3JBK0_9ACTN|nr:DUF2142 domain-containing protein [Nocardioides marmotae]MCR6031892.1 DUF2142 domain-containing protein [Gordonia jinghuaiqii]MTB95532.1 DUF2142 domain-containing protein [Nocardioides marmotae]